MELKGKNVIYIGGYGGIGQKCLEALLKKEIKNLLIFDLKNDEEYLKNLRNTYQYANIDFIPTDMSKRETIEEAYRLAKDKIEYFDIVINGSGIMDDRLIELTVAINLTGVIHSCLIALEYMNKSKGGRGGVIANVSSGSGLEPFPVMSIYSATKCGVTGFTRALSSPIYFEKTGVSFITICPGGTSTSIGHDFVAKVTMPEYIREFRDLMGKNNTQTTEEYAQSFIEVLEQAENGSVWLLDLAKYKQIEFPVLWNPALKE